MLQTFLYCLSAEAAVVARMAEAAVAPVDLTKLRILPQPRGKIIQ
jgi:hypothetical protein